MNTLKKRIFVGRKAIFILCTIITISTVTNQTKFAHIFGITPAYADVEDDLEKGVNYMYLEQFDKAFNLLSPLAEKGVLRAVPHVVILYEQNETGKNFNIYQKGVARGRYMTAEATANNQAKVKELLDKYTLKIQQAAETGGAEEQADYGLMLYGSLYYDLNNDSELTHLRINFAQEFKQKTAKDPVFAKKRADCESYLSRAAQQSNMNAAIYLIELYARAFDENEAEKLADSVQLIRLTAEQGNARSQYTFWQLNHTESVFGDETKGSAYYYLVKSAEQGNLNALSALAELYQGIYPDNKVIDSTKVINYYKKMNALGNIAANYMIGQLYAKGEIVKRDIFTAIKYYKLSAEAGLAEAQYDLGLVYISGSGIPVNIYEAKRWLELAANNHNSLAMLTLASLFKAGYFGADRKSDALIWLDKATALNSPAAYYYLAQFYDTPNETSYDPQKSSFYFKKSAELGQTESQYEYAKILASGGIKDNKDTVEAVMWLKVSLTGDYGDANEREAAEKSLMTLEAKLSEDDKKLVDRLAVKCISLNFKNCGRSSLN